MVTDIRELKIKKFKEYLLAKDYGNISIQAIELGQMVDRDGEFASTIEKHISVNDMLELNNTSPINKLVEKIYTASLEDYELEKKICNVTLESKLTPREAELLRAYEKFLTLRECAHNMGVKLSAVQSFSREIVSKTGCKSLRDVLR